MQKVFIEHQFRGSVLLPDTPNAKYIFGRIKQAYANHEPLGIHLLFNKKKLVQLQTYQKGGALEELLHLELYIALGAVLSFNTDDAKQLKNSIELTNDTAHANFNIAKRVTLVNKKNLGKTDTSYLFWDIENFSSIASIFSDIIEPYTIPDHHIYLAANPDSLYLKKREWEANLYDYGKTLNSFEFIKCDHGKNVADDVLLERFKHLNLRHSNIFMMTFDRELKERFEQACHDSNNLLMMKG
ncbi:MAG: hypothetical protein DSZ03_03030 [Sulfurimonas sp.]|nr:MAG: hypothetical protein DSZ03_03030 [Sulfurimonas sp.]